MVRWVAWLVLLAAISPVAWSHDIPNARVDRSIQVTLEPARLRVDYEVSLAEITLIQDLRMLSGEIAGDDRLAWYRRYGEIVGPLNAKGLLVTVDGRPIELHFASFNLVVEDHPRFTFQFDADLPAEGRIKLHDTNYEASQGSSRLAIRGRNGSIVEADSLSSNVSDLVARPVWELSDAEERRTREVEARFSSKPGVPSRGQVTAAAPAPVERSPRPPSPGLARLLDRTSEASVPALLALAVALGAVHALQPGHGKTLVAAAVAGESGGWHVGLLLALTTTAVHTGSVVLIALALWLTQTSRYASIDASLARTAGFVIAAAGLWRLGRHLGGHRLHDHDGDEPVRLGPRGLIGLGIAAGIVPCWDAVGLVLLSDALGRLALGFGLLVAFSLGMAVVLAAIGWLTTHAGIVVSRSERGFRWQSAIGIFASTILMGIGLYILVSV